MFKFDLDLTQQRVNVVVSGQSSGAELMTGLRQVLDDPQFANSVGTGARRAMITSSTVFYELARLFARLTAGSESKYRAFRNRADAEAWLGETGLIDDEEESDSPTV